MINRNIYQYSYLDKKKTVVFCNKWVYYNRYKIEYKKDPQFPLWFGRPSLELVPNYYE